MCCPINLISLNGQYPHDFEDPVLDNIKEWVMDENIRSSLEEQNLKHNPGQREASDSEMLKTYSTGLLAVCLAGYAYAISYLKVSHKFCVLFTFLQHSGIYHA